MLIAAALASDSELGPGLTCENLAKGLYTQPPQLATDGVSWPDTSHALNAELADTTFRLALFVPPSAARLKDPNMIARGLRCRFGADRNA